MANPASLLAKRVLRAVIQAARSQGPSASLLPATTRLDFLASIPAGCKVLEIGPFDRPQVRGPNVSYFDVMGADALRKRAQQLGRNPASVPHIDHVSPLGDLDTVRGTFEIVLSCHAVEHQPDLVRHLISVSKLLPPGGRYILVIPDKRFTFDYYLPESTIEEVRFAHASGRIVHTPESVRAHLLGTTHNSGVRHWLGLHGSPNRGDRIEQTAAEHSARAASGEYVDVHAWIFSPSRFLDIIAALCDSGAIPFNSVQVYETRVLDSEFFAILTR